MKNSNSKAFTIIELIFVILLLGILASVAVTKLNATRTDAKISVLSQEVHQVIEDIKLHAVATGNIEGNITEFSNVLGDMIEAGTAVLGNTGKQVTIDTGTENNCLTMQLVSNDRELNLSVTMGENLTHDAICSGVQEALGNQNQIMQIRGKLASY